MPITNGKRIQFELEPEEYIEFRKLTIEKNVTISEILRSLVQKYIKSQKS